MAATVDGHGKHRASSGCLAGLPNKVLEGFRLYPKVG